MSSGVVLSRLRDLFLDPAASTAAGPVRQVAERAVPATLGLLTAPEQAVGAGAALALAAGAAHGAPCAVVCRWTGAEAKAPVRSSALSAVAARRLAARLDARGLDAGACGRLVSVILPAAGEDARAAAERAAAAAGDAPVVLVVAGPRPAALDPLLARLDRLVVAPPPGAPAGLEQMAVEAAARLGRGTGVLRLPASTATAARLGARCGLLLSPALRAAAAAALRGHEEELRPDADRA